MREPLQRANATHIAHCIEISTDHDGIRSGHTPKHEKTGRRQNPMTEKATQSRLATQRSPSEGESTKYINLLISNTDRVRERMLKK